MKSSQTKQYFMDTKCKRRITGPLRAQKKTFRIGIPDREWEFSINDLVYTICLCNEAFPLLFFLVLLMRDFEKKEEIFYFFIKTLNFLLLKKKLHKSISHARII